MLRPDGVLQIDTARAFLPLLSPARYKAIRGGRGSGKSHDRGDALVDMCISFPGLRAVCLREVQKSLKRSSKQLIEDKIKAHGVQHYFRSTNTEIHTPGDGFIAFQGMQDHTAESIKSLEGVHIGWFEEAQTCSERSLELLGPTLRQDPTFNDVGDLILPGSELWFTWNTRHKTDPVDRMFFGGEPPPDSIVVEANYYDNPWFPETLRKEMEWIKQRDPERYAHIWLGGYLERSEARVFSNWIVDEFETPTDAEFLFGGDWGFSVDPTVLIRVFLDHSTRRLFIDREVYKVGCEIDRTPALFDSLDPDDKGMARKWSIVADSARPETISYMRRNGYPKIEGARKGPGSVEDGVEFLKNWDIVVHPRCIHAIEELTYYAYKVDKFTGKVLPVLADAHNHVIDAIRYAVEGIRIAIKGSVESTTSEVERNFDGSLSEQQLNAAMAAREAYDGYYKNGGEGSASGVVGFELDDYDGALT